VNAKPRPWWAYLDNRKTAERIATYWAGKETP